MTRINADLDPKTLQKRHLQAEYHEIVRVPTMLRKSLQTKSVSEILRSIPIKFTLNTGHVKFFYNKLDFLEKRYEALVKEMQRRGMKPDPNRKLDKSGIPYVFYGNANFDKQDRAIIIDRIVQRVKEKPHLYETEPTKYEAELKGRYLG